MERRPSGASTPQVVGDPVTVGPNRVIDIDLAKVLAPSNVYDADVAWVEHRQGEISLLFAKKDRNSNERFRTRLELRYPAENFVHHFWKNSLDFQSRLRDYAQRWPPAPRSVPFDASWPADKDHSEWVGFDVIAHVGTEAVMDFYQLPVPSVARFNKGLGSAGLHVIPIVRVHLSIFEMIRLFDSAGPVAEEVQKYLPDLNDAPSDHKVFVHIGAKS